MGNRSPYSPDWTDAYVHRRQVEREGYQQPIRPLAVQAEYMQTPKIDFLVRAAIVGAYAVLGLAVITISLLYHFGALR